LTTSTTRGFPATVDLADRLPVGPEDHLLDIGCGVGGPAPYFVQRFGCRVSGIDIAGPCVDAVSKLTALLDMGDRVVIEQGEGGRRPCADG
jgi:cyclopropane fatty-acyl-phospholipid synthase-like methyltransferase